MTQPVTCTSMTIEGARPAVTGRAKKATEAAALAAAVFGWAAVGCALVPAASAAQSGGATGLSVELNKLEPYDKGCRAYVVINNNTDSVYQSVKLDLVLFQPDGVIARRFAVDLAPLKSAKKSVKLFDIENLTCDKISSVLVNDVMECKSDQGPVADCLAKMTLSSVSGAPLTK